MQFGDGIHVAGQESVVQSDVQPTVDPWYKASSDKFRKKRKMENGFDLMGLSGLFNSQAEFETPEKAVKDIQFNLQWSEKESLSTRRNFSNAMDRLGYDADNPAVQRLDSIYSRASERMKLATGNSDWISLSGKDESVQKAGSGAESLKSFHGDAKAASQIMADLAADLKSFANDYPDVVKQATVDHLELYKKEISRIDIHKPVLDMSSDELHTLKADKITKIDGLITDVQNQDRLSPQRLVELRREMESLYKEPNAILEQQGVEPQVSSGFSRFVASMAYGGHSLHFANKGIQTSEQQFLGMQNNMPPERASALKAALGLQ